jgi:hypothetical protein
MGRASEIIEKVIEKSKNEAEQGSGGDGQSCATH